MNWIFKTFAMIFNSDLQQVLLKRGGICIIVVIYSKNSNLRIKIYYFYFKILNLFYFKIGIIGFVNLN